MPVFSLAPVDIVGVLVTAFVTGQAAGALVALFRFMRGR